MTKEELAAWLDGFEYPLAIPDYLEKGARAAGLVIVWGHSNDLMEFSGAIYDEVGAWEGTTVKVDVLGVLPEWESFRTDHNEEEAFARYFERRPKTKGITAIWDKEGYSWTYRTEIPHATFDVMEDGEKYCRGIVFSFSDL